jgi:hypothetical protein
MLLRVRLEKAPVVEERGANLLHTNTLRISTQPGARAQGVSVIKEGWRGKGREENSVYKYLFCSWCFSGVLVVFLFIWKQSATP